MVQHAKLPVGILAAALLGGGGTSFVLPRMAPDWYRPDPATGTELRNVKAELGTVQAELEELRQDFVHFLVEGPRRVVENQTRMEGKLDTLLDEVRRRGEEHSRAHHPVR